MRPAAERSLFEVHALNVRAALALHPLSSMAVAVPQGGIVPLLLTRANPVAPLLWVSTPDRDKVHLRAERLMAAWAEQKIVREADSQRFLVGFDLLAFSGNRSSIFAAKSHFFYFIHVTFHSPVVANTSMLLFVVTVPPRWRAW